MWWQIEVVDKATYRIHVNVWHPGLWHMVFTVLRAGGCGAFEAAWLTAVCVWQFAKRK